MPSQEYQRIWHALRQRESVTFNYKGKPRQACPVVLGYSSDGHEALSAYQTGGQTSPDRTLPGWRCFYLAHARDIKSHKGIWLEGDSHRQPQTCVQSVDVDVNIPETLTRPAPLPFGAPELQQPRGNKKRR
jgi:hypothetical protein